MLCVRICRIWFYAVSDSSESDFVGSDSTQKQISPCLIPLGIIFDGFWDSLESDSAGNQTKRKDLRICISLQGLKENSTRVQGVLQGPLGMAGENLRSKTLCYCAFKSSRSIFTFCCNSLLLEQRASLIFAFSKRKHVYFSSSQLAISSLGPEMCLKYFWIT